MRASYTPSRSGAHMCPRSSSVDLPQRTTVRSRESSPMTRRNARILLRRSRVRQGQAAGGSGRYTAIDASTASKLTGVMEAPSRHRSRRMLASLLGSGGLPTAGWAMGPAMSMPVIWPRGDGAGRRIGTAAARADIGSVHAVGGPRGVTSRAATGSLALHVTAGRVSGPVICVTENRRGSWPMRASNPPPPESRPGPRRPGMCIIVDADAYRPARPMRATSKSAGRGS